MSGERDRNLRHELRTPINHLVGYADLILDEPDVPAPLSEALTGVRELAMESLNAIASIVDSDEAVGAGALESLRATVASIEARLAPATSFVAPARAADFERVQEACARLRTLVGDLSAPGAPTRAAIATPPVDEPVAAVLVVDDDGANREVLGRRLARLGYRVLEAENGARALEILRNERIDLVLLDVMMPVLDGLGVLEQRQRDARLRGIPTIMISALDEVEGIARCIELGADDYLTKPFDPVLLKARVTASLEKKRLHDRAEELLDTVTRQAEELRSWNADLERRVEEKVREVERLSLMQRFVPPQLAEAVASGGVDLLRSHRREIAVLFCDLRGFTSFCETSEPEDVMSVLREFHDAVGPLIFERGGTLAQFTGDGMMVLFNDPVPCADPAWEAVQLAHGIQSRVAGLSAAWKARGHQLELGVGLAMGYATCGQVGFEGRYEYTAMGTVVNLAARLCGEARGGQTLVSDRIRALVDDRSRVELAGELVLKGFTRPVAVFDLAAADAR
jgi:class 3 adenylate cyclase/CheY-like chemotaxis protein